MAEEQPQTSTTANVEGVEIKDRGMFDFLSKKKVEEKPQQEEVLATELENVHVSEPVHVSAEPEVKKEEDEEKKPSLLEKLHRSDSSSSSSSSEEEVEEDGQKIKRKKQKGLKEKIKEKISPAEEKKVEEDNTVPIEKFDDEVGVVSHEGETKHPEEKKTFMAKIKEKLPGGHKNIDESASTPDVVAPPPAAPVHENTEPKEKKGILEKIKEKLPGYHKTEDEKKEPTTTEH